MTCFEAMFYFKENKIKTITFTVSPHIEKELKFKLNHPSTINLKVSISDCNMNLQYTGSTLDPVEEYEKFIVKEDKAFITSNNNVLFVKPLN